MSSSVTSERTNQHISDAIKSQAERVECAGADLQAGDVDGEADWLLDDISADLADALERLDTGACKAVLRSATGN